MAPRGVQRHRVLPVGPFDQRRRHPAEVGQRGVGGPPGRQLLAVDEAVADGFLRVELSEQLVDHDLGVGCVEAVAADPVGDHGERVGDVGIGHVFPAAGHGQHDVQRAESDAGLRLEGDVVGGEELPQCARGRRSDGRRGRRGQGGGADAGRDGGGTRRCWGRAGLGQGLLAGLRRHGDRLGDGRGCWSGQRRLGDRRLRRRGRARQTEDSGDACGARPDSSCHDPPLAGDFAHRVQPSRSSPDVYLRFRAAHPVQATNVSMRFAQPPVPGPTWNQPLTHPQRNRYQPVAREIAIGGLIPW